MNLIHPPIPPDPTPPPPPPLFAFIFLYRVAFKPSPKEQNIAQQHREDATKWLGCRKQQHRSALLFGHEDGGRIAAAPPLTRQ